jgi:ABC-type antimicrobial peptide transport system permease subunit
VLGDAGVRPTTGSVDGHRRFQGPPHRVSISRPLGNDGFVLALPYATLLILLVLGAMAGGLAAIAPARQASRIDVLEALTHQ